MPSNRMVWDSPASSDNHSTDIAHFFLPWIKFNSAVTGSIRWAMNLRMNCQNRGKSHWRVRQTDWYRSFVWLLWLRCWRGIHMGPVLILASWMSVGSYRTAVSRSTLEWERERDGKRWLKRRRERKSWRKRAEHREIRAIENVNILRGDERMCSAYFVVL